MTKEVTFTVEIPVPATDHEIADWVRFCLGDLGGISLDNPLHEYDLEGSQVEIV